MVRQSRHWRTAINRNQNLLGKLIVVLLRHEEAVSDLSRSEWAELREEVRWATRRLATAYAPDHFNYAFLQNQDRHVHLHVIPRYMSPRSVAGIEFTDPDWPDHYRPETEYIAPQELLDAIAEAFVDRAA